MSPLFLAVGALAAACPRAPPPVVVRFAPTARITTSTVDDGEGLRALVVRPAALHFAAVVYLEAIGCRSVVQATPMLRALAETGFAVLAPEKLGVDLGDDGTRCSPEFAAHDTRQQRTTEARGALTRLLPRLSGWNGQTFLVAAGEATAFAPFLARERPQIQGLVLLDGGAWDKATELSYLASAAPQGEGLDANDASATESLGERLEAMARRPDSGELWRGRPVRHWASYLYWRPLSDLLRLEVPILLTIAGADTEPRNEGAAALVAAFAAAAKRNLTARFYPTRGATWTSPDGTGHLVNLGRELGAWISLARAAAAPAAPAPAAPAAPASVSAAPAAELRAAARPKAQSFTLNGKPCDAELMPLADGAVHPTRGDVVTLDEFALELDEKVTLDYVHVDDDDEALYRRDESGALRLAALRITTADESWATRVREVPDELRGLGGITIDPSWRHALPLLAQLDLSHTYVTAELTDSTAVTPPLPSGTHNLAVVVMASDPRAPVDFQPVGRLAHLHSLKVDTEFHPLDATLLSSATELEQLSVVSGPLVHASALAALSQLRVLDVAYTHDVSSLEFARSLTELQRIDARGTDVTDLAPLAELPRLAHVDIDASRLASLANGTWPALQWLSVLGTRVTRDQATRFRTAHPSVDLRHGWLATLRREVEGTERVRVRAFGTCRHDRAKDATLLDITQPDDIAALLALVAVDEEVSTSRCRCCGDPTLEFYSQDALLAALTMHHGVTLRWNGWPADATLTPASSEALCTWLAARGVSGPRAELEEARRAADVRGRRSRCVATLLQPATLAKLEVAMDEDARFENLRLKETVASLLAAARATSGERALLFLRMLSCDDDAWESYTWLDSLLLEVVLPRLPTAEVGKALTDAATDPSAAPGAARYFLRPGTSERVQGDVAHLLAETLGPIGLTHPRASTRAATIVALGERGGGESIALLRRMLRAELAPRAVRPGFEEETVGRFSEYVAADDPCDECSERAHAAYWLARLGDHESEAAITALAAVAAAGDREVLQEALRLLRAPDAARL